VLPSRLGANARSGDVAFIQPRERIAFLTCAPPDCAAGGQEEKVEEGEDDCEDGLHFAFIAGWCEVFDLAFEGGCRRRLWLS